MQTGLPSLLLLRRYSSNKLAVFGVFKQEMLSKNQIFKLFSHSTPRRFNPLPFFVSTVTDVRTTNCSSTIPDSLDPTESPDLPGWLIASDARNPSAPSDSDEDFVIPPLASWVMNQKLDVNGDKIALHSLNEKPDTDIDRICGILNKGCSSPEIVVEALNQSGVNGSTDLVSQVLRRYSNEWIPAFGVFTWAKSRAGYRHSPDTCNIMVDILGKSKKFKLMWDLVEEMNQSSEYVSLDTMTKVMRRLARAGQYADAMEAFRGLERFGVSKDTMAMNAVMDALVKENSVEHANEVFVEFKDCIPCDSHTFNILIHGYCKARKLEEAWKIMNEMEKYGVCPDVVSYTCFIESHCKEKDFRKAYAILGEMQEKGCQPNVITYTIIMHALGKARQINEAVEIYEKMKQNGCLPDSSFYSSLIFILSKAGRLKDASQVFDDMTKQGLLRDVLTYNTMISSACSHSQEEIGLKLLGQMEEERCRPSLETYAPLLKICCKKKRMKVLSFLLNHMFKNDVSIDAGTYALLVRGLCNSGKLEQACLFFEVIVLKGMVPKDCTYKMLVKKLEGKGMTDAKERIEKLMAQSKETKDP